MDIYSIIALITFILLLVLLSIPFAVSSFSKNKPSKGSRSGDLKDLADKLGLSYKPEDERTFWDKISKYKKRESIIEGKYKGRDILIYDYHTMTNFSTGLYDSNDYADFTVINGTYHEAQLPSEKIEEIIMSADSTSQEEKISVSSLEDAYLTSPSISKNDARNVNFNTGIFVIFIFFVIVFDFTLYTIIADMISVIFMWLILAATAIILLPIGYILGKKMKYTMPIK